MTKPKDHSEATDESFAKVGENRPSDRFTVAAGAALVTLALVGAAKAAAASALVN